MKPFPSADEMNELTQASMSTRDKLLEKLKTFAARGEYECRVSGLLCPPDLQTLLTSLGYRVQSDGRVIYISWKEKNDEKENQTTNSA